MSLTLNPRYAVPAAAGGPHVLIVTQVPGGFWAVKIRERAAGRWAAFAVPRRDTEAEPFDIGIGDNEDEVFRAALNWHDQGTVMCMRMDRLVFAGRGDATDETGEEPGCEGHESLDGAHMGASVECDGRCLWTRR